MAASPPAGYSAFLRPFAAPVSLACIVLAFVFLAPAAIGADPPAPGSLEAAQAELAEARRAHPEGHPEVAALCDRVALLLLTQRLTRADWEEARTLAQESLDMRRRIHGGEHPDVAISLRTLANVQTNLAEYGAAERSLRRALAIQQRSLAADDPELVLTLGELGGLLRWQNELAEAEEILREVVAIRRRNPEAAAELAEALEALAMLHRFKREHDQAEPLLHETIEIRTRVMGPTSIGTLYGRANLALNYVYQKELEAARREFGELRAIVADAPPSVDMERVASLLDTYMAAASEAEADWPAAEEYLRRSLAGQERKGHTAEITFTLRKLGVARAAQGDMAGAEELLARSATVYEEARLKMSAGAKTAAFKRTPYELLALYRLELGRMADAWPAVESARARVLADLLVAAGTRGAAPLADAPFSLARVQATLGPATAIVGWLDAELYPEAARSWAYLIRRNGPVQWVRLTAPGTLADLSDELAAFRASLTDVAGTALGVSDDSYVSRAHALWEARFRPLEPYLKGVSDLVLIPSWSMGGFPVEVLADAGRRTVGERFAISHAPSATVHAWLREIDGDVPSPARAGLLVGDPPFRPGSGAEMAGLEPAGPAGGSRGLRNALRGDSLALGALPRLAYSRAEIAGVARTLPEANVLVGREASEPAISTLARSGAITRYDVVHIATHALIDNERPERSGLVLSQLDLSDRGGRPACDGIITGAEILDSWKLEADLVTLSACQTALGRNIIGEGVIGLTYPLLQAGARGLLVSQWKVDDEATALLMGRFYRNWLGTGAATAGRRTSKAAALRDAKQWLRAYRAEGGERPFEHPFFWASFVLVGDAD